MANYPNFYENLKEAHIRLSNTIVMYDGTPYYVWAITNHKSDERFRIYLGPINFQDKSALKITDISWPVTQIPRDHPGLGPALDSWLETKANYKYGIIRKRMDSTKFNKFRPFPLGMCNTGPITVYLERQPQRMREQGLIPAMVTETRVGLNTKVDKPPTPGWSGALNSAHGPKLVSLYTSAFISCILAEHPAPEVCLANLLSPNIDNEAIAFHRHFAFMKGPMGLLFLAYKNDIIGMLPRTDLSEVQLDRRFRHTIEVVSDLQLFSTVSIQEK